MRLVIIESPYAGEITKNVQYAREAIKDSLKRGEAPIASHLLYTQPGVLDDSNSEERKLGIDAGHAWMSSADIVAFYVDLGISPGMFLASDKAHRLGIPVEFRRIY